MRAGHISLLTAINNGASINSIVVMTWDEGQPDSTACHQSRSSKSCKFTSSHNAIKPLLLLAGLVCILLAELSTIDCHCDKLFLSTRANQVDGNVNATTTGTFDAPSRVRIKPYTMRRNLKGKLVLGGEPEIVTTTPAPKNATTTTAKPKPPEPARNGLHCLFKFIANEDERVALSFSSFKLRGTEPECNREYVDIYTQFKSDEVVEEAIGREQPNGRFCTSTVPHKLVSLNNMIVLSTYSELDPPLDDWPIFTGHYEFFKSRPVSESSIGLTQEGTLCSHSIYSWSKREGEFQSITYPGVYLKNLRCSYKFIGEPGQRIRLEFLDLDLYSGGSHCPFDAVKIFDGLEETDPIIQTICGSHRSLIIFSTREHMLVTFTTLQRESDILDRGFSAYFEFSDKFFSPNFIQGPNARHVRGSECDQRIVSTRGSTGLIEAPESKNHPNAICRYFFEGLQSSHDYEKVTLKFLEFDLKTPRFIQSGSPNQQVPATYTTAASTTTSTSTTAPASISGTSTISQITMILQASNNLVINNQTALIASGGGSGSSSNDLSSTNANGTAPDQCPDNYVRLYTGEQKPDQKQDPNDYDYVFCSNEKPTSIESDAASLMMEYNSGSIGGYFKAEYQFNVDFRIFGYQIPMSGCNYLYRSDLMKTGTFNSPRHPSWYINDMNCTFTFLAKNNEALLLQFTTFKMANQFNESIVGRNKACIGQDLVEINKLTLSPSGEITHINEIGTYCGMTTPGPLLSYKTIQVHFRTNKDTVHYGFSAIYHFHSKEELRTNEFVSNCGGTFEARDGFKNGTLASPPTYRSETYEKRNHICSWNLVARPNRRIALSFTRFELEGSPLVRGCATAAVRLTYNSSMSTELCGTISGNDIQHQYVSSGELFMVNFISTKQASGSNGFEAIWAEI